MKAGARFSKKYTIYDRTGVGCEVYCDMTSEAGVAWTLIMSEISPGMRVTATTPLFKNKPLEEENVNWYLYRLRLSRMEDLKVVSTHWRATCSLQLSGVDYTDYVRVELSRLDLIKFQGSNVCFPVEFINIRGHSCNNCTVSWWQLPGVLLHHDSSVQACDFGATPGSLGSEDNFGLYTVTNPKFRCTDADQPFSTTNHWIGGYL